MATIMMCLWPPVTWPVYCARLSGLSLSKAYHRYWWLTPVAVARLFTEPHWWCGCYVARTVPNNTAQSSSNSHLGHAKHIPYRHEAAEQRQYIVADIPLQPGSLRSLPVGPQPASMARVSGPAAGAPGRRRVRRRLERGATVIALFPPASWNA